MRLKKPGMIKGVICDLDGTLIDSEPLHHESYSRAFEEFGLHFDTKQYAGMFGTHGERFVMKAMGDGADPDVARKVVDRKTEIYQRMLALNGVKSAPGAKAFLERMKPRYKLALATSTRAANLPPLFELLGFDNIFDAIVSADDTASAKPHPEPFLLAASRLHLAPPDCLVIEDGVLGVAGAKAAGMKCIGVTACDRFDRDLSQADLVVASLNEISYETIACLEKELEDSVQPQERSE